MIETHHNLNIIAGMIIYVQQHNYDIYIDICLRCQPLYYLRVSDFLALSSYTYYVYVLIHICDCLSKTLTCSQTN